MEPELRSCTPQLTSPSPLHPTHHMDRAPMMGPSSFHPLRTNFPPPPHQPLSILSPSLSPLLLRQLGPRFLQEAFLDLPGYMRLQFLHLFIVLWDSLHVCLPQQMGASPGWILGLVHLCVSNTKYGILDPQATQCSSQATHQPRSLADLPSSWLSHCLDVLLGLPDKGDSGDASLKG